jgi:ABC-type Mn2+/Zn2+ transport system permease subunit
LFIFLLIWILNLTKIRNKIAITFLTAIMSYLCLCFTTLFFNTKGAYQIDAMIYLFGSFTAVPLGIVYGLYISFAIDHIPYEWPET